MGNSGDPRYIPDLKQAMQDPEPLVREYCAWALGRIGTPKANAILENALAKEESETVKQEIKRALDITC